MGGHSGGQAKQSGRAGLTKVLGSMAGLGLRLLLLAPPADQSKGRACAQRGKPASVEKVVAV